MSEQCTYFCIAVYMKNMEIISRSVKKKYRYNGLQRKGQKISFNPNQTKIIVFIIWQFVKVSLRYRGMFKSN